MAASPSFFSPNDAGSVAAAKEALRLFDETKAGVKGLVDSGVTKVPTLFRLSPQTASLYNTKSYQNDTAAAVTPARRAEVVEEIRRASAEMGVFQVVNHGVEGRVMKEMILKARAFHEQPHELKEGYYSRDITKKVRMYGGYASSMRVGELSWFDSLACGMRGEHVLEPQELPSICRGTIMEFSDHVRKLGKILSELFSEALGLAPNYIEKIYSVNLGRIGLHYYPACPEPEVATGQRPHFDLFTFTVLLQDHIGGLQIFHNGRWINVPPLSGAFVINVGNFMQYSFVKWQLISNGKLKAGEHKVVSNHIGPRVSVACFFEPQLDFSRATEKIYGPIEELISKKNSKVYREISLEELLGTVFSDLKSSERNSSMTCFITSK
ncbi:Deacetoxyvindoline 4-hydroxylase [Linum perenne]